MLTVMISRPDENVKELYQLIQLVRPLYKTLEASVAKELSETGTTVSQRAVLEQLLDHGPLSVPAIGRALILPRQYIQSTANSLFASGLISKRKNPAHKRSLLLELTPAGQDRITRIRAREAEVMAPIAAALPPGDIEIARKLVTQMIQGFDAHNRT